jgi:FkbH-like protein
VQLGPTAPGIEYLEFQEGLLNLTRRGILLAISSKNNPDDVLPIIRKHPYMRLREEHFAAVRINWRSKVENLPEIAQELNIGLDSLVFMDDNPHECEMMRQMLPEVLTVSLPSDPSRYRETLQEMSDFELLAITQEDETRSAQYQAMSHRRSVRAAAASLEDYLHSLDIHAIVEYAREMDVDRLVQMHNKTNQFNLTTRRYQAADITRFLAGGVYRVYTLHVQDRFGDHGFVGAAVIRSDNSRWHIDSLLMSCRVMGLGVETVLLHRIYEDAARMGITSLLGEFIPTKQNHPVKDLYEVHGFTAAPEHGENYWQLKTSETTIARPNWIKIDERRGDHDG